MSEVRPRLPFESFTFAEVKGFPENGNRYQIIDGCLWVTADPPADLQSIISKLSRLLEAVAPPALLVTQSVGVLLEKEGSESQYLLPDLMVVDRTATGAEELVIEQPFDFRVVVEALLT